ncbi:MAG: metallophosphoesterase, partial [Clostridia bacterium]|nr:metallophosphoesterase [Clostridia bacterium]
MKRMLSILLTLTMLAMPFMGVFPASMVASAVVSTTAPLVTANIDHLQTVSPSTVITITVTTQKGSTLASADTRLEGKTVATGSPVSFTPASLSLKDGVYTVVTEAKDSAGYVTIEPLTFYVDSNLNADYTLNDDGTVSTDGSLTMVQASPLSFSAGYGTTTDGNIDLSAVTSHDPSASYHLQYTDTPVEVSSASGIPYEVFNIDLQGKTSGEVAVAYTGATKKGERMALKAYNVATRKWDVLGTFVGSGNLSASLNVATYSDNGVIHVAAMLDYVTNGSNTMIWSTDPQHYTKFEDLHEYYYEIYRYAAAEYQNGNVGYIITTGDLVDDRPTASVSGKQWGVSNQAMSYVEAVGMPNGLVSGNHDVCDYKLPDYSTGENTNDYSKFWQTYPASRYNSERWYGGSINNNASHYDLITIGNVDFIVMYLGYGREATDEMIAWANQALKTYSHRTAILATHEYLDATTAKRAGRGELIYEKLVDPNPNVKMVICGHDDGALCLETTASDGRTVYEVLSDYQFVELEDPDFYANEHWIGSVPECCGDGYIRLMTVEGDTLKSVTYSPVTGRYNPRGDREVLSLDLNSGTPDRTFSTTRFSAAVLGNTTTAMNVSRVGKIVKNGITSYTTVLYQSVPSAPFDGDSTDYGNAATTPGTAYAHAAVVAPTVSQKVDVLNAVGLANDTTVSAHANYGNNALGLKVDLTKTPYLYYSFIVPTDSEFTFAFVNDTSTAPWLTYFDNQKGGGTMSSGASNWDSNKNHEQYAVTSMTGCIDMRTLLTSSSATTWTVQQLNLYHYYGEPATLNYLFFGDAATTVAWPNTAFGPPVTTNMNTGAYVSELPPAVDHKTDVLTAVGLSDQTAVNGYKAYAGANLTVNLNKTPYLYYSFAVQPGEKFTLGFISSTTTAPWLSYIDAANNGQLNFNNDTWNAQNGAQYSATSLTGCIDMRKYVTDPTASTWKIEELRFYPSSYETAVVSYLFFGSESTNAMKDYGTANDYLALQKLLTKANALSTSGYTSASVSEFNAAKSAASSVSASSEDAVKAAYGRLEQAMGALTKTKTSISASSLVSVKNYPINTSSWKCGTTGATLTSGSSWLAATATSTGLILKRTSNATHMWPSIHYTGSGASYTVNPNGKVYLNIDVTAGNNWFIELSVTQNGKSVVVRPNVAIENGFVSTETHGHEGVFQGVYDISDAFLAVGLDPKATFNVTKTLFYVIGDDLRMTATLNHFEMMTDPASAVDYTPIYDAISDATHRTQSMYTSASWSTMQSALSAAYTAANNTSITSAALNLAAHKLRMAIDALVYVNRYEPAGSLL